MNKTKLYLIIIVIVLIPIAVISFKKETNFSMEEEKIINDNKEPQNLNDYIYHVVAAEMPMLFNEEAIKAQIVAVRTYTLNSLEENKKIKKDAQAYMTDEELKQRWQTHYDEYSKKLSDLVNSNNEIMTYNNSPIKAFYFSMSNGYTTSSLAVFNEEYDYIKVVESPLERNINNFEVTIELSTEEFSKKLNITPPIIINEIRKDSTNRVEEIKINNKTFKGTEFRKILNLRSTDFVIELGNTAKITTKGYGHGVGMSQYGANELAKLGYNYKEILNYYYKDIKIENFNE